MERARCLERRYSASSSSILVRRTVLIVRVTVSSSARQSEPPLRIFIVFKFITVSWIAITNNTMACRRSSEDTVHFFWTEGTTFRNRSSESGRLGTYVETQQASLQTCLGSLRRLRSIGIASTTRKRTHEEIDRC